VTHRLGEEIARGTRSTVFAWGRDAVVKVPHADTPDEWVEYEATYTAAVHAVGAPVPRMLGLEVMESSLLDAGVAPELGRVLRLRL